MYPPRAKHFLGVQVCVCVFTFPKKTRNGNKIIKKSKKCFFNLQIYSTCESHNPHWRNTLTRACTSTDRRSKTLVCTKPNRQKATNSIFHSKKQANKTYCLLSLKASLKPCFRSSETQQHYFISSFFCKQKKYLLL